MTRKGRQKPASTDPISIVPAALRTQNGNQLRTYMELQLRGADMAPVRASARSIAAAIQSTHTSVLRALRRLEDAGWARHTGNPHAPVWQVFYEPAQRA